ncbi:hypothetical protein, partial [Acinetobacter baumannii]|uniref:hypothetical protein n=1 Tax=Acinetobacter baumannii TaxID=470 RepID=UPI00165FB811
GIGNGNGDDVDITAPITGVLNISGNSFTLIGNSSSSSVNTAPSPEPLPEPPRAFTPLSPVPLPL